MKLIISSLLLFLFLPQSAGAATFCVAGNGIPPQCIYDDAALCKREALKSSSSSCTVNPDIKLNYNGGSTYCVVGSDLMGQCIFSDRSQCRAEADNRRAVCIERDIQPGSDRNPYRYDQRIQK